MENNNTAVSLPFKNPENILSQPTAKFITKTNAPLSQNKNINLKFSIKKFLMLLLFIIIFISLIQVVNS
jgi:hypothetical protein